MKTGSIVLRHVTNQSVQLEGCIMGGRGETVSYKRFYRKLESKEHKEALKKDIEAIIETVTTTITIITLVETGDDKKGQGSGGQSGPGG
jgi:hypothetical protein